MTDVVDEELRKAILQEAEEGDIGEVLLEGWQLGIYLNQGESPAVHGGRGCHIKHCFL